jgi:hypothetical protein
MLNVHYAEAVCSEYHIFIVILNVHYTECCYAECNYAESRGVHSPCICFIPSRQINRANSLRLKLDGLAPELHLGVHRSPEDKVAAAVKVGSVVSGDWRVMAHLKREPKLIILGFQLKTFCSFYCHFNVAS